MLKSLRQQSGEAEAYSTQQTVPFIGRQISTAKLDKSIETSVPRRSERIPKQVAILLIGTDAQGKSFMEETKTVLLSRHGASVISAHKLAIQQELLIVQRERDSETPVRVVGQVGANGNFYIYGVAFLETDIDFWGIDFAPAPEATTSDLCPVLECGVCGTRESAGPGELETGMYESRDGALRYCERCGSPTSWKFALTKNPEQSGLPVSEAPRPAVERPLRNRRRHLRAKAGFSVLVRVRGQAEVVFCENISLGGLCFQSSHRYVEKARVEVAAAHSSGTTCILVPAEIVYVQEVPEKNTFRYGAQYVPTASERSGCAAA